VILRFRYRVARFPVRPGHPFRARQRRNFKPRNPRFEITKPFSDGLRRPELCNFVIGNLNPHAVGVFKLQNFKITDYQIEA